MYGSTSVSCPVQRWGKYLSTKRPKLKLPARKHSKPVQMKRSKFISILLIAACAAVLPVEAKLFELKYVPSVGWVREYTLPYQDKDWHYMLCEYTSRRPFRGEKMYSVAYYRPKPGARPTSIVVQTFAAPTKNAPLVTNWCITGK